MDGSVFGIRRTADAEGGGEIRFQQALDFYTDALSTLQMEVLNPLAGANPGGALSLEAEIHSLRSNPCIESMESAQRRLGRTLQEVGRLIRSHLGGVAELHEALTILATTRRLLEGTEGRGSAPEDKPATLNESWRGLRVQAERIQELALAMRQDNLRMVAELGEEMDRYRQRLGEAVESAKRDDLTGLSNQRVLRQSLIELAEAGTTFCVLLIDLNRFDAISALHGWQTGEELLQSFAERLRGEVKQEEFVARWGRDEFAVVLACPLSSAKRRARLLEQGVTGEYVLRAEDHPLRIRLGVSMGLTEYRHGETADTLLARADDLLSERIRR